MQTRLVRSSSDRMLGGVCGGLAEYLNIDSTIIRIVFAVSIFAVGPITPMAYILLWIIMPRDIDVNTVAQYQPPQPQPADQASQTYQSPYLTQQLHEQPAANQPQQDPTGEWRYDPYTGEPIRQQQPNP